VAADESESEQWTFGVEPLPETVTAASLVRRIAGLLVALENGGPAVDEAVADLARLEARLATLVPDVVAPRVGDAAEGDGRVYVDHSRDIGAFNPCFPDYDLTTDGDTATGTVRFPIAYEGPPGLVHGGFLAVFFDAAMQHHHCDAGIAGKTTSLSLRYRRPTPLEVDLRFELSRAVVDGKLRSEGRLWRGDEVCCEAEMWALVGDPAALPAVGPRRRAGS
jgi:acyl-coenzyme A thioesterase PaaI-like protein